MEWPGPVPALPPTPQDWDLRGLGLAWAWGLKLLVAQLYGRAEDGGSGPGWLELIAPLFSRFLRRVRKPAACTH